MLCCALVFLLARLPAGCGLLSCVHAVWPGQGPAKAHVGPGGRQCRQPHPGAIHQVHVPHGRLQEGSSTANSAATRAMAAGRRDGDFTMHMCVVAACCAVGCRAVNQQVVVVLLAAIWAWAAWEHLWKACTCGQHVIADLMHAEGTPQRALRCK